MPDVEATKKNKTRQVNFKVTEDQYSVLEEAARAHFSEPAIWARHAVLRAAAKDRKIRLRGNVLQRADRTQPPLPPLAEVQIAGCECKFNGNGVRFQRSACPVHGAKKAVGT
jgi:hypothetical protein